VSFVFLDLDGETRRRMAAEHTRDVAANSDWDSPRFADGGRERFRNALQQACRDGNDVTLAEDVRRQGMLRTREVRNGKNGRIEAAVPVTAPETLAEGEFNRYYIRALCSRALDENRQLVVWRAKEVTSPRQEFEALLGKLVQPAAVLEDLRTGKRVDEAFGLPAGPNSGLSVRFEDGA
jgi:hypothetical protein